MTQNKVLYKIACTNAQCETWILRKSSDGFWRFSLKSMRVDEDGQNVTVVCKSCGTEVPVPMFFSLPLGFDLQKAEQSFVPKIVAEPELPLLKGALVIKRCASQKKK